MPQQSQNPHVRSGPDAPDAVPGGPAPHRQCRSYAPGHRVHWIHWRQVRREPGPLIPVHVQVVRGDRLRIEAARSAARAAMVCWNHDLDSVREALAQSGGGGEWDRRWHMLRVPACREDGLPATRLINLARPGDAAGCR